eukprot:2352900-Amphidinium_carterae.3
MRTKGHQASQTEHEQPEGGKVHITQAKLSPAANCVRTSFVLNMPSSIEQGEHKGLPAPSTKCTGVTMRILEATAAKAIRLQGGECGRSPPPPHGKVELIIVIVNNAREEPNLASTNPEHRSYLTIWRRRVQAAAIPPGSTGSGKSRGVRSFNAYLMSSRWYRLSASAAGALCPPEFAPRDELALPLLPPPETSTSNDKSGCRQAPTELSNCKQW